ncbi:MAG TPA: secretion protein HlyD [Planctomycetaceae bacterium]|nr:secretion protein HlyD [Planctomycetaceae bacterium]
MNAPAERQKKDAAQADAGQLPRRRWPWLAITIIFLAGLIAAAWFIFAGEDENDTQLVLQGNIDVRQVNLAFKVEGRIETLAVDEGDLVKTGQIVATLDNRYFNDELRVARAHRNNLAANLAKLEHGSRPEEIAQARAQTADREATLARAKEDFNRAKNLVGKGAVSRQEYDQYQSALVSAEAQVNVARESQRLVEIGPRKEDIDMARAQLAEQDATIEQSERRLADSELIAPSDGVILTRARERGAIVQAGETVFTLTLAAPVWVRTYVDERDLGFVSQGIEAQVATDTAPDRPYSGKIGFVSPTAEFTPKAVETRELRTDLVYRLRVVVDNPDGGLRQGMPVTVKLPLPHPRPKTFWQRARAAIRARLHLQK